MFFEHADMCFSIHSVIEEIFCIKLRVREKTVDRAETETWNLETFTERFVE